MLCGKDGGYCITKTFLQVSSVGVREMLQTMAFILEIIFVAGVILFVFIITRLPTSDDDASCRQKDTAKKASPGRTAAVNQHQKSTETTTAIQDKSLRSQKVSEKSPDSKLDPIPRPESAKKKEEFNRKQKPSKSKANTYKNVTQDQENTKKKSTNASSEAVHKLKPRTIVTDFSKNVILHLSDIKRSSKFKDDSKQHQRTTNADQATSNFRGFYLENDVKYHELDSVEINPDINFVSSQFQNATLEPTLNLDSNVQNNLEVNNRTTDRKHSKNCSKLSSGSSIYGITTDLLHPDRGGDSSATEKAIAVEAIYVDDCRQIPSARREGSRPILVVEQTKRITGNEASTSNGDISNESVELKNNKDDDKEANEPVKHNVGNWACAINAAQNCRERKFPDRLAESKRSFYQPLQTNHTRRCGHLVDHQRLGKAEKNSSGAVRKNWQSRLRNDREVIVIEADEDDDNTVENIRVNDVGPKLYPGYGVNVAYNRQHNYGRTSHRPAQRNWEENGAEGHSYTLSWNIGDVIADLESNFVAKQATNCDEKTDNEESRTCDTAPDIKDVVGTPPKDDLEGGDEDEKQILEATSETSDTKSDLKVDDSDSSESEDNNSNKDPALPVSVATFADRWFLRGLNTINDLDPDKVFVRQDGVLTLDVRCGTKKEVHAIVHYFLGTTKGEKVQIVTGRGLRSFNKIPVINKVVEQILLGEEIEFKIISKGGAYEFNYG